MFACWFQPGFISHDTVFFFHNKSVAVGLISVETNQRTGCKKKMLGGIHLLREIMRTQKD